MTKVEAAKKYLEDIRLLNKTSYTIDDIEAANGYYSEGVSFVELVV